MDFRSAYDPRRFQSVAEGVLGQLAASVDAAINAKRPVLQWSEPEVLRDFWKMSRGGLPHGIGSKPSDGVSEGSGPLSSGLSREIGPIVEAILRQSITLHHPGYMGHQNAPVLPVAALADLIVSVINSSSAIYEMGSATTMIEKAMVDWMNGHIGFQSGDGVFTSGGSLGNLTALLAGRQAMKGRDVWTDGVCGDKRLSVMASSFSHYSVRRSVQIMGLGEHGFIGLPVDSRFRIDPTQLENELSRATREGREVFAIVASSCNTALGTYDSLEELADFAKKHSLWLHVDGAHGASALLSKKYRHYLKGIERADSVVWDAHKMLLMPALTSAVLFRSPTASARTFSQNASYLFEKSVDEEWYNISHRTLECTKRAFALRLYLGLAAYGDEIFSDYVTRQYDLGRAFAELIESRSEFELALIPDSNIVCFRHRESINSDEVQRRLRGLAVKSGDYYLVQTELPRGLFLRVSLMNPMTEVSHLESLLDFLVEARKGL